VALSVGYVTVRGGRPVPAHASREASRRLVMVTEVAATALLLLLLLLILACVLIVSEMHGCTHALSAYVLCRISFTFRMTAESRATNNRR